MRFGQFLKIVRAAEHGVVVELLIPNLHHMQDDLRILWVVFVPAVVQGLAGTGQCDRRHQLHIETGVHKPVSQSAVVIARSLKGCAVR